MQYLCVKKLGEIIKVSSPSLLELAMSKVGIIGWGTYIPRFRIRLTDIAFTWGYDLGIVSGLGVIEKSVEGVDEDSITMAIEASYNALLRSRISPDKIGAVLFGSESKPYAVKPGATIVAEVLGITPNTMASDLEFACRASGEALRIAIALTMSSQARHVLAIGSDTAQACPGNILELTASSGAAAYIIGSEGDIAAIIEGSYTYVTDTPDFWRRELAPYPLHAEAFTGEPAYFHHIEMAVKGLLENLGLRCSDFDYVIFHQPNASFPLRIAKRLGFSMDKVLPGLVVRHIGNTYSASALIGLARVLENAKPGSRILLATYGSGAGSDAFSLVVLDKVVDIRDRAPKVDDYINRKKLIDYATYAKFRNLLVMYDGV